MLMDRLRKQENHSLWKLIWWQLKGTFSIQICSAIVHMIFGRVSLTIRAYSAWFPARATHWPESHVCDFCSVVQHHTIVQEALNHHHKVGDTSDPHFWMFSKRQLWEYLHAYCNTGLLSIQEMELLIQRTALDYQISWSSTLHITVTGSVNQSYILFCVTTC